MFSLRAELILSGICFKVLYPVLPFLIFTLYLFYTCVISEHIVYCYDRKKKQSVLKVINTTRITNLLEGNGLVK